MKKVISLLLITILVLSLLTACGQNDKVPVEEPEQTEEPATETGDATAEDVEADVVVIGAGGAGLAAALSASEQGAKVILIEKMPMVGGNTIRATGGINAAGTPTQEAQDVEDDVETFVADTMAGGKEVNNPALVQVLAENSKDAVAWLEEKGADLSDVGLGGGATNKRFHRPAGGSAVGPEVVMTLKEAVENDGNIELLLKTEVTEILAEDNAVKGVKAVGEAGEFNVIAPAVVLTTGGYSANQAMVIKYVPELEGFATTNHPGATGEGIAMAEAIGANLVDMEHIQTHPTVVPEKGIMITEAVRGNGAILVNRDGQRFVDEMETRDVVSKAVLEQEGKSAFLVFDDQVRESLGAIEKYIEQNLVTEGDAETLCETLGIDEAQFIETIKAYQEAVSSGSDELGRENMEVSFDPEGYFYAVEITPAVHHTMGGVEIDTEAHVINTDGDAIDGFFAAGECSGGVHGANRLGGNAMADIIVFGRIAGTNAANYSK